MCLTNVNSNQNSPYLAVMIVWKIIHFPLSPYRTSILSRFHIYNLFFSIIQILIVPVLTSFGLIFKDKFQQLNLSSLDAALILNLNSALGMTLGLFNGALLKFFGYRKVAIFGGILFSGGLVATSFADSFRHFLITYSIITCELRHESCLRDSLIY